VPGGEDELLRFGIGPIGCFGYKGIIIYQFSRS